MANGRSLFWVLLVAVTGCASRAPLATVSSGPPAKSSLGARLTSPAPISAASPCDDANAQRAKVPQLLAEGRLYRTLQVLDEANRLCPASRDSTRVAELQTLAELGRTQAARELASRILEQQPSDAERQAVDQALKLISERERSEANTEDARAATTKILQMAEAAASEHRYKDANQLLVEAWPQWSSNNGRALAMAGHFAKLAADIPRAQRLFDRALEALERLYATEVRVQVATLSSLQHTIRPADIESATNPSGMARSIARTRSRVSQLGRAVRLPRTKQLAIADGSDIVILEAENFRELLRLRGHAGNVTHLAISRDERVLATTSEDETIRLWNISDGTQARILKGTKEPGVVAFSPNGKVLASASGNATIRLWRVSDGALLRVLRGHRERVTAIDFSPGGETIASSAGDGDIRLWTSSDGSLTRTLKGHCDRSKSNCQLSPISVAYSPDGKTLVSASDDGIIQLWHSHDGSPLRSAKVDDRVNSVAFSAGGQWIVASILEGRYVGVCRASDMKLARTFSELPGFYAANFVSEDPLVQLITRDSIIELGETLQSARVVRDHREEAVAVSPDGTLIASATGNNVRVRRFSDGALLSSLVGHQGPVTQLAFAPDSKWLASASEDKSVRLWAMPSGRLVRSLEGHTESVISVAFAPDGKSLASGSCSSARASNSSDSIHFWAIDGRAIRSFMPDSCASALSFSPDGKKLAFTSWREHANLLSVTDGSPVCEIDHDVRFGGFSADGRSLFLATDHSIDVVSSTACKDTNSVYSISYPMANHDLAIARDGQSMAVSQGDSLFPTRVTLLRTADGASLRTFDEHNRSSLLSFALHPTGKWLVTSGRDGLHIWDTPSGKLAMQLMSAEDHDVQITLSGAGEFFDLSGKDQAWAGEALLCRVGPVALPLEVCAERTRMPGLGAKLLSSSMARNTPN